MISVYHDIFTGEQFQYLEEVARWVEDYRWDLYFARRFEWDEVHTLLSPDQVKVARLRLLLSDE